MVSTYSCSGEGEDFLRRRHFVAVLVNDINCLFADLFLLCAAIAAGPLNEMKNILFMVVDGLNDWVGSLCEYPQLKMT